MIWGLHDETVEVYAKTCLQRHIYKYTVHTVFIRRLVYSVLQRNFYKCGICTVQYILFLGCTVSLEECSYKVVFQKL